MFLIWAKPIFLIVIPKRLLSRFPSRFTTLPAPSRIRQPSNRIIYLVIFLFLLCACPAVSAQPRLALETAEYELGSLTPGEIIEQNIPVRNKGTATLEVSKVRSSCNCITARIINNSAAPGGETGIFFVFDPAQLDKNGGFKKYLYIHSNDPDRPVVRLTISGRRDDNGSANDGARIELQVFYSSGCRQCAKLADWLITDLAKKYSSLIEVMTYDLTVPENYEKLVRLEDQYSVRENDPIIIFAGTRYFSGKEAIRRQLEPYLEELGTEKPRAVRPPLPDSNKDGSSCRRSRFRPLVVISAGLIDGINPCAFVTIIFLISFLYFIEKTRREIFLVGITFAAAVFLSYFLFGLGLWSFLAGLVVYKMIAKIIYIAALALVFLLALFSLYDFIVSLRGNLWNRMIIQLPLSVKQKIHQLIRNSLRSRRLLLSVFVTGILVSVFEGICTGQVYLPTIIYLVRKPLARGMGIYYLVLYNAAFIVPLLLVLLLTMAGVRLEKMISFSRRNIAWSKLLLFLLFLCLGILLLLNG